MGKTKTAVIGFDIGGTNFRYSVFPVVNGRIGEKALFENKVSTEKGPEGLKKTIKQAYKDAKAGASEYKIVAMGVGSPGRPISTPEAGPNSFVVAKSSVGNLEEKPGDLDGVDLQALMQSAVPKVPIYINNDAIVQMQAMLVEVTQKIGATNFLGKDVGYIGFGSGLGGGFAAVDKNKVISPHTDGHIYDALLQLPEDIAELREKSANTTTGKKFQFAPDGNSIRAEDVLSGNAFFEMTGLRGENIKDEASAKAVRLTLELMGRALAELVIKIRTGSLQKIDPEANWPEVDLKRVKETSTFLMGGGMANNPLLMSTIEETAQKKLREGGVNVRFVSVPDKETTRAAANLVPNKLLQRSNQL